MNKRLIVVAMAFAVVVSFGGRLAYVQAATPSPSKAIVISPFLSETKILPTDASKDVSVNLTNNTGRDQSFIISALDFGSLDETGGVVFAGENAGKLTHKYGLANWLQLPKDHVTLSSGQTTKLMATIVNQPSLGPGGHYAALIMTVDNPKSDAPATVNVQQKISALLFATKVGGEVYDLRLAKVQPDGNWQQLPKNITLNFQNTGNVHVVPRGTVRLIAPSGHVVSKGVINEASAYVLPETSRQFIVTTSSASSHGWEPGSYKLQVDYRYDGHETFASKSTMIRYYNLTGIIFAVLAITAVIFIGYKLHRIRAKKPEITA